MKHTYRDGIAVPVSFFVNRNAIFGLYILLLRSILRLGSKAVRRLDIPI